MEKVKLYEKFLIVSSIAANTSLVAYSEAMENNIANMISWVGIFIFADFLSRKLNPLKPLNKVKLLTLGGIAILGSLSTKMPVQNVESNLTTVLSCLGTFVLADVLNRKLNPEKSLKKSSFLILGGIAVGITGYLLPDMKPSVMTNTIIGNSIIYGVFLPIMIGFSGLASASANNIINWKNKLTKEVSYQKKKI